ETSPHLPAPQNVEIYSYNFQSWLRWSPVTVENGSVLYTAHYRTAAFGEWSAMGCAHTPHTRCALPTALGRRWTVQLRVRAELGNLSSAWVHSPAFVPERDTTLGPPRVNSVSASPDSLLISVTPPFPPEHGDSLLYLVSYWDNSSSPAGKKELSVMETLFQIGNLQESTVYCFSIRVQLKIFSGHLVGEQRAPECHRTALS
ncbi:INGR2 protein, partial [Toxostoma redivivum]|nr:INGR2 protein [Toxostoma redivivum]